MNHHLLILILVLGFSTSLTAQSTNFQKKRVPLEDNPQYALMIQKYPALEAIDFFRITYFSDSLRINGAIITPKTAGKFPCIVYNRGGNRDYGIPKFKDLLRRGLVDLAAQGYVVALSYYRGAGGSEGQDEYGGSDVNDVINLMDQLGNEPKADTSSIGMLGWSRGAIMTYRSLVETNKIKAIVVGGGATDLFETLVSRPAFEKGIYEELIPNYTDNKEKVLSERSAVKWVDRFPKDVPILLLHGGNDSHVSPSQTLNFSLELERYHIPYKLIIFEGDNHGIATHQPDVTREIQEWFKRYLQENEAVPATQLNRINQHDQ